VPDNPGTGGLVYGAVTAAGNAIAAELNAATLLNA
jgi:hypothetical protein